MTRMRPPQQIGDDDLTDKATQRSIGSLTVNFYTVKFISKLLTNRKMESFPKQNFGFIPDFDHSACTARGARCSLLWRRRKFFLSMQHSSHLHSIRQTAFANRRTVPTLPKLVTPSCSFSYSTSSSSSSSSSSCSSS